MLMSNAIKRLIKSADDLSRRTHVSVENFNVIISHPGVKAYFETTFPEALSAWLMKPDFYFRLDNQVCYPMRVLVIWKENDMFYSEFPSFNSETETYKMQLGTESYTLNKATWLNEHAIRSDDGFTLLSAAELPKTNVFLRRAVDLVKEEIRNSPEMQEWNKFLRSV